MENLAAGNIGMIAAARGLVTRLVHGRLSRNGLFALVQGLFVTFCVFLVYRLVILHAGLEPFGVWSLLMACTAVARLLDVSGGGALARFVATASSGKDDGFRARDYVHTVVLTGLALNLLFGLVFWLTAPLVLPIFVAPLLIDEARALVPWAIGFGIVSALAYATVSALDGAQRADLRAIAVMASYAVFLATSWFLVPRFGVVGFAASQIAQQGLMCALAWVVLRRHVPGLGWAPRCWRRNVFAETTGYALKLNAVGVIGLLFDPLAKFTFNHAGGPGLVAIFDLATRLVTQLRLIVTTAAGTLTPAFAARSHPGDPTFRSILDTSLRIAALASVGLAVAALAAAPVVSLLVFGRLSAELLGMNAALTAGWATNTLALPLYFAAQGTGVLRWNLASQTLISASVLASAFFLAPTLGPPSVVAAIVAGLLASTLALLLGNAHTFHAMDIVRNRWRLLAGAAITIMLLCASTGLTLTLIVH